MASSYTNEVDDVEMSCKGMQLLLNNDIDACEALFDQYRFYSPLMNGGWAFVSFMVINLILIEKICFRQYHHLKVNSIVGHIFK
ncbi:unnamed protein product [Rotaria sp. Silwood1]|nr:unnamed protein product [Rotaria sp. Silwood1]